MADLGCLHLETRYLSWDAARNNCKALGGDLFVPADEEQFISLGNYYYQMDMLVKKWVGMFLHQWLNDRPENEVWYPGEPNYDGDCALMRSSTLEDKPCELEYYSICQK
ncbi:C-type lectin domain family 4 member M-like [Penaeus chinensis]|uniref:C-type lectin domain family 4 member M-like n=1 Tax=Penaeus chinensis TaxID=139456 RepID=UPI001FB831BC|nr:C-type lectin domain family 4 member M-like [Penaeus chinensis]